MKIRNPIYSEILSFDDNQIDLRKWIDPQISVKVGIDLVTFFVRFVEKYHEIVFQDNSNN